MRTLSSTAYASTPKLADNSSHVREPSKESHATSQHFEIDRHHELDCSRAAVEPHRLQRGRAKLQICGSQVDQQRRSVSSNDDCDRGDWRRQIEKSAFDIAPASYCPSVDIVGINAYGGAASIPERYRKAGGTKPYLLAEYGPRGPWDFEKNDIGSVDEELGKVKATTYLDSFKAVNADRQLCLGCYAFEWGHKQEATPTWFGMFLADGRKTPVVDALAENGQAKTVENLCPIIDSLVLVDAETVKVNSELTAKIQAHDPEKRSLKVEWILMEDAKRHETGGYFQTTPPSFKKNILKSLSYASHLSSSKKTRSLPDLCLRWRWQGSC